MSETTDAISPAVIDVEASLGRLVERLSGTPALLGPAVFIPDGWHPNTANVVAVVDAPDARPSRLKFAHGNILGHQVDTTATTVGRVLIDRQSGPSLSRMNPENHIVWNQYLEPRREEPVVLQLAFDRRQLGMGQEVPITEQVLTPSLPGISQAVARLLEASEQTVSLGDRLHLHMPVTPNAYILKWDVNRSTARVRNNYPAFRDYYQKLGGIAYALAAEYGAYVAANTGDGQNIILPLPPDVDRNDSYDIGTFGDETAMHLARELIVKHQEVASVYSKPPVIRAALGLGHVETLQNTEEVSGPVFWEAARLLKRRLLPPNSITCTKPAKKALLLAQKPT